MTRMSDAWYLTWLTLVILLAVGLLVLASVPAAGQARRIPPSFTKVDKPIDIKWGQEVVAVSDPNDRALRLVSATDNNWVCAPYVSGPKQERGYSCKSFGDVVAWILQEGQR